MKLHAFLFLKIVGTLVLIATIFSIKAQHASACSVHPCILFTPVETANLREKVTGGVSEATEAFKRFCTNCTYNRNSSAATNYHETALRAYLDINGVTQTPQSAVSETALYASAKASLIKDAAQVPTLTSDVYLEAMRISRMAITFDILKAAEQLSPSEEQSIIHHFEQWIESMQGYVFSGASPTTGATHTIAAYPAVSSNGSSAIASGLSLLGLILKDNQYADQSGLEALIVVNKNRIKNGNNAFISDGGIYGEGFRYGTFGPLTHALYAAIALSNNGYENENTLFGNLIKTPQWFAYSLLGKSRYPYFADTRQTDTLAKRTPFELYYLIRNLWNSGELNYARFSKNRLDYIYTNLLNKGTLSDSGAEGVSAHLARALWFPENIPTGFDTTLVTPSAWFYGNADGGGTYRVSARRGTGGVAILNNRLTASVESGGDRLVSLFHIIKGRAMNHEGPDSGSFSVMLKDDLGAQAFLADAGAVQQSNWIGGANTDHNIIRRIPEFISGNIFRYNAGLYDGTLKAKVIGRENSYVRATHKGVWGMQNSASRTVAFFGDDDDSNQLYSIFYDIADDGQAGAYEQSFNSEVPGAASTNSLSFTGSGGKSVVLKFAFPQQGLVFSTPQSASAISIDHNAYKNTVSQTTSGNTPAEFLYTMHFGFGRDGASPSLVPVETLLEFPNGHGKGLKIAWGNGDVDFAFVRAPAEETLNYQTPEITLISDAQFVWLRKTNGVITRYMVGEGSNAVIDGIALFESITPGTKINISVGRGINLEQFDPLLAPQALPPSTLYLPKISMSQSASGQTEVRWNGQNISQSQYAISGGRMYINTPATGECKVRFVSWKGVGDSIQGNRIAQLGGSSESCPDEHPINIRLFDGTSLNVSPESDAPRIIARTANNVFEKNVQMQWKSADGSEAPVQYRVEAIAQNQTSPPVVTQNTLKVTRPNALFRVPERVEAGRDARMTFSTSAETPTPVHIFLGVVPPLDDPEYLPSADGGQLPIYWQPSSLGSNYFEIGQGIASIGDPFEFRYPVPKKIQVGLVYISALYTVRESNGVDASVVWAPQKVTVLAKSGFIWTQGLINALTVGGAIIILFLIFWAWESYKKRHQLGVTNYPFMDGLTPGGNVPPSNPTPPDIIATKPTELPQEKV